MGTDLKGRELGKFLSERANGTYMAKYHNSNGQLKYILDKNLDNLRTKLETALTNDIHGIGGDGLDVTVNEFFSIWINKYKSNLAGTTKAGYRNAYNHIANAIGEMNLTDVRAIDFINLFDDMQEMGHKPSSIQQVKMISQQIFQAALSNDFISKNPLLGVILYSKKEIKKMVLSDIEIERFFTYIHKAKYDWENLYQLLYLTGMRSGEIRSLIWDNINFKKMQITIDRTVREINKNGERKFEINNPKTKSSSRIIPITPAIEKVLITHKGNNETVDIDTYSEFGDLVFTKNGKMISQSSLCSSLRSIEKYMNDERLVIQHLHPHMFRHMFTSQAIASGMNIKNVSAILGHKSIRTTLDIYDHPTQDNLKDSMSKFKAIGVKMV
ncbi:tyrosine-type recombinase/integrase [[Clostridium] fimetarium]|uniref:Site-specific recombinase XerD n=1 Tax=[Clostridium] fimetarium TaxID=99656 RepID=A0A1I0QVF8_9FIRM|nr:site-specific integrase [[Clostridium] fimetarium]SEW31571.1 Site-specific recombinase XerD [[Clostridium] fimetarium]